MGEDIFRGAKKLGFGLMRLPSRSVDNPGDIDLDAMKQMVDYYIEQGFTYFDTAWMYCAFQSENATKEALVKRYPREAFTLADKLHSGFINTEEDRDKIFNEQRRKTGVEYFDYYLIHDVNTGSIVHYDRLHVFDWILDKKKQGLVKHAGFSFHDSPELLDKVLTDYPEMEFVQIQLNYLDYNSQAIRSRECYEVATKHGVPVIIMEPIKGGTLINLPEEAVSLFHEANPSASVASWAIRFAASHDNVRMVLSGMSNPEQMKDNVSYMKDFVPLTEEEKQVIRKVVSIMNRTTEIPCTGCSYCTDGCPAHIAIPKFFSLYNAEMKEDPKGLKGWTAQKGYYNNLCETFGKASACVDCKQCEHICPQHLKVTEYLRAVAERFEA